ncbi:MAG TPA: hypothetical protein VJR27_03695 [Candidatus Saccharimonadales bacterium]|nr:hypothetical protein [Candidatus Saccharimonadales bacterium]
MMRKPYEVTRGGELLTIIPHYSEKGEDGRRLAEMAAEFAAGDRALYRRFDRLTRHHLPVLRLLGATASAAMFAGVGYMWAHNAESYVSPPTAQARAVLEDPRQMRTLGICSLELQKEVEFAQYLEQKGETTASGVKAVEYDAAARLAADNKIACEPQVSTATSNVSVSSGVLQFDVGLACNDAAYYKAASGPDGAELYALNVQLATASGQTC